MVLLAFADGACARAPPSRPLRATDVVEGLGVCIHLNNSRPDQILAALRFLGLRRIRTDPPKADQLGPSSPFEILAKVGVRATYFVNGGLGRRGAPRVDELGALAKLARNYPGSIEFIEGPNEVNNWPLRYAGFRDQRGHPWPGGRRAARSFQSDLYTQAKADPNLGGLPIIAYTDVTAAEGPADLSNTHIYSGRAAIDGAAERQAARLRLNAPTRPLAATEWGFTTPTPLRAIGVSQSGQRDRILAGWAELARLGFRQTYIYELHDDGQDPANPEDHYGLFNFNWSPKPAASALAGLIRLLKDPSASARTFTPQPFEAWAAGAHALVAQKADRSMVVLFWRWAPRSPHSLDIHLSQVRDVRRLDLLGGAGTSLGRSDRFAVPYSSGLVVLGVSSH